MHGSSSDLGQAQLERTQRKATKQAVSIDLQNKTYCLKMINLFLLT